MRSGRRERPASASVLVSSTHGTAESDLFQMLLPNAHAHIPKGKAAMWDQHYQQQHQLAQRASPTTPTRPQTTCRSVVTTPPPHTPKYSPASPVNTSPVAQRRKNVDSSSSPRSLKLAVVRPPLSARAVTDPRQEADTLNKLAVGGFYTIEASSSSNQLRLNTEAREHVEMKACMLAHMHRIDVDALHLLRTQACRELDEFRSKKVLARGGVLDDGGLLESTKRKTAFLLRHFFALGEPSCTAASQKQESVLHDVIDEWSCRDNASPDGIAALWSSVVAHMEQSYVLRRLLAPRADPNPLSLTIAMDCLRKLPTKLPDYRRMLDVIIVLLESGLYSPPRPSADGLATLNTMEPSASGRYFYFDECHALRVALERELNEKRARLVAEAQLNAANTRSPRQELMAILADLRSGSGAGSDEIEALFTLFFKWDIRRLTPVALREALQVCFDSDTADEDIRRIFFDTWIPLLEPEDATEVLVQLAAHHVTAFQTFLHDELDAVDALLMKPLSFIMPATNLARHNSNTAADLSGSTRRRSRRTAAPVSNSLASTTLFHALIERHPAQFASVLWESPYLTAHVFQDSQHLIARILEHNIILVSQVLQQRPDVLTTLLNHTLKENAIAIEDFLLNHPKALSDLLLNKGPAVATAIKSCPSILVDILQGSRPTLSKVLMSTPDLLCQLFKSTPDLLAQTLREDPTILPLAFSVVPQSLSDALERHPEYFVDVAHRKPTLVAKIFAKYPDLLLDPLEANPSVFSSFLVYHRKILPDFSSPTFDPSFFQFERKQFVDSAQQTEKRLCKYDGRLRVRERIQFQEEAQVHAVRQSLANMAAMLSANGRATPVAGGNGRTTPALPTERPVVKESSPINNGSVFVPSPGHVVGEIARLYILKLAADTLLDARGKKRRVLVDFVLDLYIQELGFKSKAQQRLTILLAGAKQAEQESLRIKWFLRFMNAGSLSTPTALLASSAETLDLMWTYHPLASAFYLAAMQFLVALPNEELLQRLEEELTRPCLVGYTRVKLFLDDPLMTRMLPTKDQRQVFLTGICEKEQLIHMTASEGTMTTARASSVAVASMTTTLHLEDVLESLMLVWMQYQERIRSEWMTQFHLVNLDGSGVVRFSTFADLIRAKLPAMEDRGIVKIYHQCGEDNDLGEYSIAVDDFSLAMSIVQEQEAIRDYAARLGSNASSRQ